MPLIIAFNLLTMSLIMFQGSYGIVKLAYNESDDAHYVSKIWRFLLWFLIFS